MYYEKFCNTIKNFTEKLQDEQSKALYDARFKYYLNRDVQELERNIMNVMKKHQNKCFCPGLHYYFKQNPQKDDKNISFVIFGSGYMGRATIRTLKFLGYNISAVVDNDLNRQGMEVEGYNVNKPDIIIEEEYKNACVVIAMLPCYQEEVYPQLLNMGIADENILRYSTGGLFGDFGNQYFDLDEMCPDSDGEIFIDAGCCDGYSSYNASIWANGRLDKIIAFEPDKNSIKNCEDRIKK